MKELLEMFSIDLEKMERVFNLQDRPFVMHGDLVPDHVISELYQVPDAIRKEYLVCQGVGASCDVENGGSFCSWGRAAVFL